jgi:hypothetical protein
MGAKPEMLRMLASLAYVPDRIGSDISGYRPVESAAVPPQVGWQVFACNGHAF